MKTLNPAFDSDGTITAATSSPISVGSAAMILMSDNKANELANAQPIRSYNYNMLIKKEHSGASN